MTKMKRREFLGFSALGAGALLLSAGGCQPISRPAAQVEENAQSSESAAAEVGSNGASAADQQTLTTNMADAAERFLSGVGQGDGAQVVYDFADEERFRWHWTTPGRVARNGLSLRAMDQAQKTLALDLLAATVPAAAVEKALNIMSLQTDLGSDPELYYFTLFGTQNADGGGINYEEPWGWRLEGHHLSRHFTVIDCEVIMTPFFLGAWPTETDSGLRAMPVEEDAALELVNALSGEARAAAILQQESYRQHFTQNAVEVSPLDEAGLAYADMEAGQQQNVMQLIETYLAAMPPALAASHLARIQAAGFDAIRFGWAGSTEIRNPQYYRLQGPTFLLEYDNSRNGGTHIHSVWRDFGRDFGLHLVQ